jgi:DNA-binding NarL/FixJ family response regulator
MSSVTQSRVAVKQGPPNTLSDVFLYIISSNTLQNELLMPYLHNNTGFETECLPDIDDEKFHNKNYNGNRYFVLIDYESIDSKGLWKEINSLKSAPDTAQFLFALYNVSSKAQIEKKAMENGVNGIFYNSDSPDILSKGIHSILDGDYWYSRRTLMKCLLESMPLETANEKMGSDELLTLREKEILELIAQGYNSRKISDELFISIHTVKTHIYNVYNKINVNNRLQATLWAAKYL